jgi:dTDP-4-dehydrorhamnose 3,5-epimerase
VGGPLCDSDPIAAGVGLIFTPTPIGGTYIVEIEPRNDDRGFFARTWCAEELSRAGLVANLSQCSISNNRYAYTLRGMHYQTEPDIETKLVSCRAGALFDVIVDLRPESPTYKQWFGTELTAGNYRSLYISPGIAHGFLTLENNTEVSYQISGTYAPTSGRSVRWNDPAFGIQWPTKPAMMTERDRDYPDFLA